MNREELIELLDAVADINEEIDDQLTGVRYTIWSYLSIETNSETVRVQIAGVTIWDDEDDDREWIEDEQMSEGGVQWVNPAHYQPWGPYLRRKINELVADIAKIKL